ncbi:phenylalanyl-tRNA synthetase [Johnsonella ignava ATCC 51276]|uniref:Phenylalanine--tRNA ligase beta subunit n=1 Tax=Johnsonella ignava ATCC 51276 TaxID=679200 RepID=G5GFQ4_9FIRM|nr:phenylalanine--tRNA ligase subunit beta [Johnsonella ignava]EHI56531.1 phenylalanyl-tRNA synthetase [Johnsonella ignava ATCC 51276]
MKTALSWIKEYVPGLEVDDEKYSETMTITGTKVEGYERLDKNLDKIVAARVVSMEKHPNADKLMVCMCDVGGDKNLQIVTGAKNVAEGDMVPVVLSGGRVASVHGKDEIPEDGVKISKGKLRGIESDGMMCSIEEFGLDRNYYPEAPEDGIYILDKDVKPGTDVVELLGLHDTVFEYEITSNRVDCYGVSGIAREAAAAFDKDFKEPEIIKTGNSEDINDYLSVKILDDKLCRRYIARMVKNIKIAPSPAWLRHRLAASGIRPINNIVDITNYVMEEYGQPMHAFDYDTIEGHEIIVKRANDGEEFTTLDGQQRKLDHDILMINDAKRAIGIAGIMGGENSKIRDDVTTMVFEAATFDGTNIRLSSKRLGLRTDASSKFEKGLCAQSAYKAIERACTLIEQLGAGEVVGGIIDEYPNKDAQVEIDFKPDEINALLGTEYITKYEMIFYLKRLGIKYDEQTGKVICPDFRNDLESNADLAEEVARIYGYEMIDTTLPRGETTLGGCSFEKRVEDAATLAARFLGFSETMSYSFESPKVFDKLNISENDKMREAVKIMNPLGEDFSIMRTCPVNGILNSLALNYNRRNKSVKLYESARIYMPKSLPLTELPDERKQLVLGFYDCGDFFDMKGAVQTIFKFTGVNGKKTYSPDCDKAFLHPGQRADILYEGEKLGYLGRLHPEVADNYGISQKTFIAVIDIENVIKYSNFDTKFNEIAKFPAMSRDISLVVPKAVTAGTIEEIIEEKSGSILESYKLFDVYEGGQIADGFKSMAYNIIFRHRERTLEEKEVSQIISDILKELEKLDIKLRN